MADLGPEIAPGWPLLSPLGVCDGRLMLCGTALPSDDEIDDLFAAAQDRADEIFAAVEPYHVRIRSAVAAHDWRSADSESLATWHTHASMLVVAAEASGTPTRMLYGVLLVGGLVPFRSTSRALEAQPRCRPTGRDPDQWPST